MNTIAICQPYFAPYIGYFQLINAVDLFISYDDVNFIKHGWINRNKITVNKTEKLFTIPLKDQSSFKKINEVMVDWDNKSINKFVKTIEQSYSKAKYKNETLEIIDKILSTEMPTIAELALTSIVEFCNYLEIKTEIKVSSLGKYSKTEDRVKNLINICKVENKKHYINPIGGTKLYRKEEFAEHGLNLSFLSGLSGLSIIDVCMNNSIEEIKKQLQQYTLV